MAINPAAVTLDTLKKKHPERSQWEVVWSDYQLSYLGGYAFIRAAGEFALFATASTTSTTGATANAIHNQFHTPRRRFLRQLEGEPNPVYVSVWDKAEYVNYLSAILDYHRHWLFSTPPNIRVQDGEECPDWHEDFSEDADGSGKSFLDFIRDVFLDVLICRRSGWMIRSDDEDPNRALLKHYKCADILDWQKDAKGELEWITLRQLETRRAFPNDRVEVEVYTYIDRTDWYEWEVVKDKDGNESLKLVDSNTHGLDRVPFVMMELPHGLWITDKLYAWQIGLFNQWTRLKAAMLNGCIVQPFKKTADTGGSNVFGEGTIIYLRPGDGAGGHDEDFGWKSPDISPIKFVWDHLKEARDEGYRIVHQMALAVDSKAIGAIARSGASKIEDRKASEIILAAYGGYVRDAMMRTLSIMSEVYGDASEWIVDGFDNFNVSSLDDEIQIAALAQSMGFKSTTAKQEIELKVLGRLLDHLDESTKDKINDETVDAYQMEAEAAMAPPVIPQVVGEDGKPTPAVGAPIGGGPMPPKPGSNSIMPPKKLGYADKESK